MGATPPLRECPLRATLWRLVVEPRRAKEKTEGGIIIPESTKDADEAFCCVGRVVHIGSQAFKSRPQEGIDFAEEPLKPKIGDWVLFSRHSGQRVKLTDGREYRYLADSDILGPVGDPEEVVAYV